VREDGRRVWWIERFRLNLEAWDVIPIPRHDDPYDKATNVTVAVRVRVNSQEIDEGLARETYDLKEFHRRQRHPLIEDVQFLP
jgi:hypothetical protein